MFDMLIYVYIFVLGSVIGSFLNVLIYRIPLQRSVAKGYSHCPNCNTRLQAIDLVPIASYAALGGKCRYCNEPISIRYPLIEALTGLLFVVSFHVFQLTPQFGLNAILISILVVITMIDFDTQLIPDRLQIALLLLAITQLVFFKVNLMDHLIGFFVVSIPFAILAMLGGMGGGDVKLMAIAGLYLGWQSIIVAAFVGILLGGLYGAFLLFSKKATRKMEIAFGPYLCIGIFFASLYGNQIIQWYLSLL